MNRTHFILQEMGLGPIWLSRNPTAEEEMQAVQPSSVEPPITEPPLASPKPFVEEETRHNNALSAVRVDEQPTISPSELVQNQPIPQAAITQQAHSSWEELHKMVQECTNCRLCQTRTQTVFGRGNPKAKWLFIGEAPGEQEDKQGYPFVGKAGQLLDNILYAAGLDREQDIYIANVVKCRPPGNRNPAGDEIVACQDYLLQQIKHINPTIIIALGRFAAQTLLNTEQSISRLRGKAHQYQGIPLIATFHPAYLLRNLSDKSKAWQDMVLARKIFTQQQTST